MNINDFDFEEELNEEELEEIEEEVYDILEDMKKLPKAEQVEIMSLLEQSYLNLENKRTVHNKNNYALIDAKYDARTRLNKDIEYGVINATKQNNYKAVDYYFNQGATNYINVGLIAIENNNSRIFNRLLQAIMQNISDKSDRSILYYLYIGEMVKKNKTNLLEIIEQHMKNNEERHNFINKLINNIVRHNKINLIRIYLVNGKFNKYNIESLIEEIIIEDKDDMFKLLMDELDKDGRNVALRISNNYKRYDLVRYIEQEYDFDEYEDLIDDMDDLDISY